MGSETGDMWREIKEEIRQHRVDQLAENLEWWKVNTYPFHWTTHRKDHWTMTLRGMTLQYWPSANKWQWAGRIMAGKPQQLLNFILKRL